ncbi:hypothetical protein THRCLA_02690 [Thraustotheca clavata]|uniref:PDZ domain-containing protein n=1 Tax=Thraustotheca clavata TaxID=74557 RepID=A0A1W0A4L0_9STRA|nr:hypothetical protein THRCLA_02690 [Thraustotheca clavata]
METNILPEGLYPVIVSQPWVRLASTTYWNLELEFIFDSKSIPLHDIEQVKAVCDIKGQVKVKRIVPINKSPLDQIEVGNYLIAINNQDLCDLSAETIQSLLQQGTESAFTILLFYRANYTDVNYLFQQSRPTIDPFEIGQYFSNAWYYTHEYRLFATFDHSNEAITREMTTPMWETYHNRRNELMKTLDIWVQIFSKLTDQLWRSICGIIFDEQVQSEMTVPCKCCYYLLVLYSHTDIAHLNMNQDSRHILYRVIFESPTSAMWDLDLVVQAPFSLIAESLFATKAQKGIAIVRSSPLTHEIAPGDILVAVNDIFLTTSIPSLIKRLKRATSISSQKHSTSLLFLRQTQLPPSREAII